MLNLRKRRPVFTSRSATFHAAMNLSIHIGRTRSDRKSNWLTVILSRREMLSHDLSYHYFHIFAPFLGVSREEMSSLLREFRASFSPLVLTARARDLLGVHHDEDMRGTIRGLCAIATDTRTPSSPSDPSERVSRTERTKSG
ncbi:hypothetical protein ACS0PU_003125 [Formica fusca]